MRYPPERQTVHQNSAPQMHQQPAPRVHQQPAPRMHQNQALHQHPAKERQPVQKNHTSPKDKDKVCPCCEKREKNILEKLLPENIYNPKTKKLFGILSPEELLLASLIFLFADSDREDSNLLCLALLYLLFADKFDLSAFLK